MTKDEALKLALEALETLDVGDSYKTHNAASALRQALEQPSDIEAAVRAENEACSEIAYSMVYSEDEAEEIAKAIRARVK